MISVLNYLCTAQTSWASFLKKKKKIPHWSTRCGSGVMNPMSIYEDVDSIPGLIQWLKDPVLP